MKKIGIIGSRDFKEKEIIAKFMRTLKDVEIVSGGAAGADTFAEEIAKELGAKSVALRDDIAKISVVGVGMRTHSGVAAKMFETLSKHGVNILMISTSEIKVSCVID